MVARAGASLLGLLSTIAVLALAGCGSSSSGGPSQPVDCVKRCRAYAAMCTNDVAQCDALCTTLTETQLSCLEHAACDHDKVAMCLPTTTGAGGGGGAGGAASGGSSPGGHSTGGGSDQGAGGGLPMCLGDGESGCTNAAEGPNCCAPAVCDPGKQMCCTARPNTPCTKDDDCCGAGLGTVHCMAGPVGDKLCVINQ